MNSIEVLRSILVALAAGFLLLLGLFISQAGDRYKDYIRDNNQNKPIIIWPEVQHR